MKTEKGKSFKNMTWYKDAIIYELHVRAFKDSNDDGIGDFKGLIEKLDYLKDLGITCIWLLPFYSSPLKDDGYDISDYKKIHKSYGDIKDFKKFIREAHKRDLRVITEIVLNHTSDQHNWFQKSRKAKEGTKWRDFYVWGNNPNKYGKARIIFKDFESSNWGWDPLAKKYYWHRFYGHQPDLNYNSKHLQEYIFEVVDYWLKIGVDGLRLDAVPYLYERENTNCENLPQTHKFLKNLREHIDDKFKNKMILAEANQWPEDAAEYFGKGNECNMAFHFPLMPRLFMALQMEDRFHIVDIIRQTPEIPESCQWALFLRNHDELTLEMVTDEERDYMYRMYATDHQMRLNLGIRRRLSPLLGNNRKKIELINGLLFSLPGTPVIYYGDEINMGDNIYLGDRNGVRTPMQWSGSKNAGFSACNPQRLYLPTIIDPEYHYQTINVETQQTNLHSLFWWMKRIIAIRKKYKPLSRGATKFLEPDNYKILAFLREYEGEIILAVFNLSRFSQSVELDLSSYENYTPVEIFGMSKFPKIESKYPLSLGPHTFYWFLLKKEKVKPEEKNIKDFKDRLPLIDVDDKWKFFTNTKQVAELEKQISRIVVTRRWFASKGEKIKKINIVDHITIPTKKINDFLVLIQVNYYKKESEYYLIILSFVESIDEIEENSVVAKVKYKDTEGWLIEGTNNQDFWINFLNLFENKIRKKSRKLKVKKYKKLNKALEELNKDKISVTISKGEQSNTSIIYGDQLILKLYRKIEYGKNPELETLSFLTKRNFKNTPSLLSFIEYNSGKKNATFAIVQNFVKHQDNGWNYTKENILKYLEKAYAQRKEIKKISLPSKNLLKLEISDVPPLLEEIMNPFFEEVKILGKRTAELHNTLSIKIKKQKEFQPEPVSKLYLRALYQSIRTLTISTFNNIKKSKNIPEEIKKDLDEILESQNSILNYSKKILNSTLNGKRIRCHNDYHLGQVLFTGNDFIIIDFEGEPARPIGERIIKRIPLYDIAGMLRSLHYSAYSILFSKNQSFYTESEEIEFVEYCLKLWFYYIRIPFIDSYFRNIKSKIIPKNKLEIQVLLDIHILEKAIYELGYELNNRPDWIIIPIKGIKALLNEINENRE